MSMLERLPTVDEMIAALSSPVVPSTNTQEAVELSTDEMVRAIFEKIMTPPAVS